MLSLVTIVATATGAVLVQCSSKDRETKRKSNKSGKSSKSGKSAKSSKSNKSKRSSSTAGSKSSRASSRSKRSRRSSKDAKKAAKGSEKEKKKADKSDKSGKEKLDKDGKPIPVPADGGSSKKSKKSSKSSKKQQIQKDGAEKSLSAESEKKLNSVPNNANYTFPEGQVKSSSLKPNPNKLPFAPTGGVQSVAISNSTKSRKAFKVKTSDNMLYRVNPVYGFVEPGASASIDVLRHNGEKKTDHLVVLTSDATAGQTAAKEVFEANPMRELTVIPLVAH